MKLLHEHTPGAAAAPPAASALMVLPLATYNEVGDGQMAALAAWLRGGGHVDAQEEKLGNTMLQLASAKGEEAMVAALLQRGASANLQNKAGRR